MKKMTGMIAVIMLMSSAASAQLYLQGGLNFANITKTNSGQTEDNNVLTTFNVGLMNRFNLAGPIAIETGVLLSGKGSKAETFFNGGNDYVKTKFNPVYVEIPLNLVVKVPTPGLGLFFDAGPYLGIGVAGQSKVDSKVGVVTSSSSSDIEFNDDDPFTSQQEDASYSKLKRFDYGINLGGGISISKVMVKLNYGIGLTKINSTQGNNSADDKNKYRTLSLSLGISL